MSKVYVVVPNKRRVAVEVTPNKSVQEIATEACQRSGYDVDRHQMKWHGRSLDGALPFRLSGVTVNGVLELVPLESSTTKTAQPATVTLHVSMTNQRHTAEFKPDTSLSEMLQKFEEITNERLLVPNSNDTSVQPVCVHCNKTYSSAVLLAATKLSQMGIRGGARELIRYNTRKMQQDELLTIERDLSQKNEKRVKWDQEFEAKRLQNEQRMQLEKQRDAEVERELAAKRASEEKLAKARLAASTERNVPEASGSTMPATQPSTQAQSNNNAANATTRLSHLQHMLQDVDTELTNQEAVFQTSDFARNAQQLARAMQPFRDFKFPEQPTPPSSVPVSAESSSSNVPDSTRRSPEIVELAPECDRRPMLIKIEELNQLHRQQYENVAQNLDDDFFQLDVQDAQRRQKELTATVRNESERALMPASAIARENTKRKQNTMVHTVVRVNLPTHDCILQMLFNSMEPVSRVYDSVATLLSIDKSTIRLKLPPNFSIANTDQHTLLDCDLSPKCTLILLCNTTVDNKFENTSVPLVSVVEADRVSMEWLSSNQPFVPYNPTVNDSGETSASSNGALPPDRARRGLVKHTGGPVPKWFTGKR